MSIINFTIKILRDEFGVELYAIELYELHICMITVIRSIFWVEEKMGTGNDGVSWLQTHFLSTPDTFI